MFEPLSDPILVFAILISIILVAPLLAERIRVPDLVLLLLAGTVLGPHGFGLLARDEAITMLGSVGLLYIMFMAGLDIDLYRFAQTRRRSVSFGLLTFAIPQALGTLAGRFVLGFSWPSSILLASLFASHTLLAYPIASRLGIVRREPVTVTVGATIITDIMALMVLAIIADMAKGIELGVFFWGGIAGGLAGIVFLAWWVIPRLSRWFFHRVPEKGGAQFLFVLAVVSGFAYLSHHAKMEPIIGAFLAGVAFNRLIPQNSVLMNRVEFAGSTLFVPFFLISVGMLVDPGALVSDPRGWLVAGVMIAGVVISKWLAADLARRLFGYSREEGRVMFGLSVVQAAATLAAVLVGFELGIFNASVLNGAIAMILVTCPLGAWMVDRHGRTMAASSSGEEQRPAPAGRSPQRYLVPVSNPTAAVNLVDLALLLRDDSLPGDVQPLTIVHEGINPENEVAAGEKLLALCMSHAAAANCTVNAGLRLAINVGDGITRAARELRSDAVIMGWSTHQRGRPRIFGTALATLLDECPARIIVSRLTQPVNVTQRVLLPLPPLAARCGGLETTIRDAKWLTRQIGAELCVFCVAADTEAQLHHMVDDIRPSVPVSFISLPDWRSVRTHLLADIKENDLAFIPAGRQHGSFWMPGFDRLPETLAAAFPDLNVLAVYPPIEAGSPQTDSGAYAGDDRLIRVLPAGGTIAAPDTADAVREMVEQALPHLTADQRQQVMSLLLESATSFPVEMAPGLVILHGHGDSVDRPTLLVAVAKTPWTFETLEKPARILLGLISPQERTGRVHLQALAELAGSLRRPGTLERLAQASSAPEVCAVMSEPDIQPQTSES